MHILPHTYRARAEAGASGLVTLRCGELPTIPSASPPQFGGPGGVWSPEDLLVAAVADCLVLTFRAVARVAQLPWTSLDVEVDGILERVERVTRFTTFEVRARLRVPAGTDLALAEQSLQRAEHGCLISNSLNATVRLVPRVETSG
jgi:organic hydroperoxide reductase OsmC/OhrA